MNGNHGKGRLGALIIGAILVAACGEPLLFEDAPTTATAPKDDAAERPADAAPDAVAADPIPSCTQQTTFAELTADTALMLDAPASCPGSISYGTSDGLNILIGAGVLRFTLDTDQRAAFAEDRVVSMKLQVDSHPTCEGCTTPLPAVAGTIKVHPMRSDWDEGTKLGEKGADACRRTTAGAGWGSAQVASSGTRIATNADYGTTAAGAAAYADDALAVDVPLAPAVVRAFHSTRGDVAPATLSFLLRSDAMLIVASREASAPRRAPRLAITTCAR